MAQKRPYQFTGEWKAIAAEELLDKELLAHYGGDYFICKTEEGRGFVRHHLGQWTGWLCYQDSEAVLWSTFYRHRDEVLNEAQAKDLVEAALVCASICGLENVGRMGSGCCP
jgi:hypothetical protein